MVSRNTEVSRLLILGPDKDSTLAVVSKLRELCGDSDSDAQDDDKSDAAVLNLQTKYYRAPVEVHVHQVLANEPEPALHHELCDYEAVICVVDSEHRESFLHMHRFAKRIVDASPYDVCLLVASTLSTTTESVKQMESWCQDNGFEFVTLDCAKHTLSDDDHVISEKQGVERVLEALHCNMWRSMKMNPSQPETGAPLKAATEAVKTKSDEERQAEDEKRSANTEKQRSSMDESRLHTLLQALEIPGDPGASAGDGGGDDKEIDIDMAQFGALISEVRDVRDQGQSLTDEERRDRAAEVALKLWNLLGASDSD